MKAYIQVRPDLANSAAVAAAVTDNPVQYSTGTIIIPADGTFNYVSAYGTVTTIT